MDSEKVEINGTPAVCFSSENKRILIWNLNEDYLVLRTSLEADIAMQAAASVKK